MASHRFPGFACGLTLLLWLGCVAPLLGADETSPSPSALEQSPAGWTDLLAKAGPNLDGWVRVAMPTKGQPGKLNEVSQWSLDSMTNTLVCAGDRGHEFFRWDQELGDFIYHVEWRFTPDPRGKGYNSGVFVRNSADGTIWHQAQTGDARTFLFADTMVNGKIERVNLAKQVRDQRVRPVGEWNTFEITCKGKDISLWVNGAVVTEWHDCNVPRGYVGLEAEGYRIEFRNLKVKPL
jgi:hypothetical protein